MSSSDARSFSQHVLNRRKALKLGVAAGLSAAALRSADTRAALLQETSDTGVDETWTLEHVRAIAGTLKVDTAADCAKVVPLDHKGKISYWYLGPNQASTEIQKQMDDDFWAAFKKTYPNIEVEINNLDYNSMLDKVRTAALGGAAPAVARMPILWGVEFAAKGQLQEFGPEDVGFKVDDFWPGAINSVKWKDKLYGIPTNNETMSMM
ncbi:MAG TPA: extracellular solute-binding protein, partial [Thermomicrobiales bacterium]|nr:extracellular solute-binding protein [Thermomicrobiales bacterium]